MDAIDKRILEILSKDSRKKYVDLAREVGLTEGAIRRRVGSLVRSNVIRKFTIETSVELEGIVLIETEPNKTADVTSRLRKIADKVFEVSGDYDVAAIIRAYTIEDLNREIDRIRNISFILNTRTLIKLKD